MMTQGNAGRDNGYGAQSYSVVLLSAFFWTWFLSTLLSPSLVGRDPAMHSFQALLVVSTLMSGMACMVASARRGSIVFSFLDSGRNELLLVLAGSATSVLVALGSAANAFPLAVACGVVLGATSTCYLLTWSLMYGRDGALSACLLPLGALAISVVAVAFVSLLPQMAAVFVMTLIPLVNLVLLTVVRDLSEQREEGAPRPFKQEGKGERKGGQATAASGVYMGPTSLSDNPYSVVPNAGAKAHADRFGGVPPMVLAGLLAVGTCLGLLYAQVALLGSSSWDMDAPFAVYGVAVVAVVVVAAGVVCVAAACGGRHVFDAVSVLVGIGFIGFFAIAAGSAAPAWVGIVALPGLVGLFALAWMMVAELAQMEGKVPVVVYSLCFAALYVGLLVGVAVPFALTLVGVALQPQLVQTLAVYLLTVGLLMLLTDGATLWEVAKAKLERERPSLVIDGAFSVDRDLSKASIRKKGGQYGLTGRECDVLECLLGGHSRSRVAQMLGVSENTVNSHVNHIYSKMGVGSRQELLDLFLDVL